MQLPKDTGTAIAETDSEEDEDEKPAVPIQDGGDSPSKEPVVKTPAQIALEVLNEIVDIVLESEDVTQNQIVTNQLLQKNIHKLHKQVFVKVKVQENQLNTQ